jgi:hypothetical protein
VNTQSTYIGTGATTLTQIIPDKPVLPAPMVQFNLESTVGCAAQPFTVGFKLIFDPTLHLDPGSSTCTRGACPGE